MTDWNIDDLLKNTLSQETDIPENVKSKLLSKINSAPERKGIKFTKIIRSAAVAAACFLLSICVAANVSETAYQNLSKIPVVGTITQALTFRTYEDAEGGFEAYMEIPEVEGFGKATKDVNKEIDSYAKELIAMYEADKKSANAEGHYAMISGYYTVGDNEDYFSLRVWTNVIMAGTNEFNKFVVVDKKNEKIIGFSDLFPTDESKMELKKALISKMNDIMTKNEQIVYWHDEMTIDNNTKFYVTSDNEIVISFDKYEIAPGAYGVQEFRVGIVEDGKAVLGKTPVDALFSIAGEVIEATIGNVIIETWDGKTYAFDKQDAEIITHGEGLLIGSTVEIFYYGSLENATVARIEVY